MTRTSQRPEGPEAFTLTASPEVARLVAAVEGACDTLEKLSGGVQRSDTERYRAVAAEARRTCEGGGGATSRLGRTRYVDEATIESLTVAAGTTAETWLRRMLAGRDGERTHRELRAAFTIAADLVFEEERREQPRGLDIVHRIGIGDPAPRRGDVLDIGAQTTVTVEIVQRLEEHDGDEDRAYALRVGVNETVDSAAAAE